jgi:hypothetical protein
MTLATCRSFPPRRDRPAADRRFCAILASELSPKIVIRSGLDLP